MNHKQFQVIPTTVVFESDAIYDTYVNIDDNLQTNIDIYNAFIKLTIDFVRKTCKYLPYCSFKMLYSCFG